MRPPVAVLVLLLLLPGAATGTIHSPSTHGAPIGPSPAAPPSAAPTLPAPVDRAILPSSFFNTTLLTPPTAPHAGPPPVSVIGSEPDPTLPPTVPSVIQFPVNVTSGAGKQNFTAPTGGPWARILFNFTGTVVPDVYDSSYRAYIDGVLVMFGTTPEYGTWTVLRDLTEYSALFHGSVSLYYQLSAADITGHFLESVTLSFYPTLPGQAAPPAANDVLPLWSTPYVHSASPIAWGYQTIPNNVTNATLEIWTYGLGPTDEFWYLQNPAYRGLQLSVDGTRFITLLPFEYVNTGGIDLFLWRPITGVLTTNDRPEQFDATPMLGLLEGYHNFSVTMGGIGASGNSWLIGGTLLLNTSATTGGATTTAFHYSGELVRTSGLDREVNFTYVYGSRIPTAGGVEWANETIAGLFSSNVSETGSWQNLSMEERTAANDSRVIAGYRALSEQVLSFPFSLDLSGTFQLTRTTGGGYPEFGNFTTEMLNAVQDWGETVSTTVFSLAAPPARSFTNISFRLEGANGVFGGTEEFTSPGVPVITSLTSSDSSTPKTAFFQETLDGTDGSYLHTIVGGGYNPPGPYNVEAILTNQVTTSVSAAVLLSTALVEVGGNLAVTAVADGGAGWLHYTWTSLPPGCSAGDQPSLRCHPSLSGTYRASVTVSDALGGLATGQSIPLTVTTAVASSITGAPVASDEGSAVSLAAAINGGVPPYTCAWSVDGAGLVTQACSLPFAYTLNGTGALLFAVQVTDSAGDPSNSSSASVQVNTPPSVQIVPPSPTASASVGTPIALRAAVANGTGPYSYTWMVDGTEVASGTSSELNYTFSTAGAHTVVVRSQDAEGLAAVSQPITVQVGSHATSSGSTASSDYWWAVAVAGWIVAGIAGLFLLQPGRRRPPARRANPPTYREKPASGSP
ncbi:MAG: PKD domain-containing protein [Thermoplasmata archaeon]|nr:PKD domain-containing protein [Thermoplasmata archaeon]